LNVPENPEIRVAKHRPSKFPEIESELLKWLMDSLDSKILLTDSVIRAKAKEVSKNMQIPDDKFKASSGWVENFKQRHGIKRGVWHGEGRNVKMARALGYGPGYEPPPQDDEPRPTIADFIFKHNLYDLNVAITPLPILMQRTYPESEDEDDIVETDGNAQAGPSGASAGPQSPLHGQGSSGMHSPVHAGPPPSHAPADQQAAAGDTSMSSLSTTLSTAVQPTPAEDLGMPTAAEAEEAMSTVLRFVDAQSVGFVTQDEQHALRRVKHAIVQLGSGVPYDR
ncbi:CenpB-DNA-bind-domain-containing protein, partial [Artomyces pyxidatus]